MVDEGAGFGYYEEGEDGPRTGESVRRGKGVSVEVRTNISGGEPGEGCRVVRSRQRHSRYTSARREWPRNKRATVRKCN